MKQLTISVPDEVDLELVYQHAAQAEEAAHANSVTAADTAHAERLSEAVGLLDRLRQGGELHTIIIAMGREQAREQVTQLENALSSEAETVMLLTTSSEEAQATMHRVMGDPHLLLGMPEPDLIILDAVWTIGLPVTIEQFEQVAQEWGAE